MMEVMEVPPQPSPSATTPPIIDEFLQTTRTGRRNALTEEEEQHLQAVEQAAVVSSMQKLSCSDEAAGEGSSGHGQGECSKEKTNTQQQQSETQSSEDSAGQTRANT